jgi:hypothetical protein
MSFAEPTTHQDLTPEERGVLAAQFTEAFAAIATEQPNDPIPEPDEEEAPL